MQFQLTLNPSPLIDPITYRDRLMLVGSCFTEHIGDSLSEWKFRTLQNSHGILFGPDAICEALSDIIRLRTYTNSDLFYWQECWHSWHHHSRFSSTDPAVALDRINGSIREAHGFLKQTDWLILTLGSAFTYRLTDAAERGGKTTGDSVANCHRAPSGWFTKEMMATDQILIRLQDMIQDLRRLNPTIKLMVTISPVRHIRDGAVENNRSKARLIQVVQTLTEEINNVFYFPAYEYVIDVLRDYRYYDIDLVHPNFAATQFVLDRFADFAFDTQTRSLMDEIKSLRVARKHRPQHPDTQAHRQFLSAHYQKSLELQKRLPELDFSDELSYFSAD